MALTEKEELVELVVKYTNGVPSSANVSRAQIILKDDEEVARLPKTVEEITVEQAQVIFGETQAALIKEMQDKAKEILDKEKAFQDKVKELDTKTREVEALRLEKEALQHEQARKEADAPKPKPDASPILGE